MRFVKRRRSGCEAASRAEILIKADRPMKRLILILTGAAVRTTVVARVQGRSQDVTISPGEFAPAGVQSRRRFPLRRALDLEGIGLEQ